MGEGFELNIVTVLPVLNEEQHIEACLDALIHQTYPSAKHSVLVMDGGSSDQTQMLVQEAIQRSTAAAGPKIELHHNAGKFVAQGRNQAMDLLHDDVTHVLELIGHSTVAPTHLEHLSTEWQRISQMEQRPLAALGSRVMPRQGELRTVECWIEATLNSPFGSGGGQFDTFTEASPCRIPAFVLHKRSALVDVSGWNEAFISSQDSDLSMRLSAAGYALWRTPKTQVHMTKRSSLKRWWRMGHRYGFWRTKTVLKHPSRLSLREYLPWFGLMLTAVLFALQHPFASVPLVAYLLVLSVEGVRMSFRFGRFSLLLGFPICMIVLHASFSLGLVDGLVRKGGAASDR